ncbi:MAG: PhzF family phenazine biosynthesis protein [Pseudolabrys sp.]
MQRRFFTLDVFTARPFAGNPLAVVLDADGLDPSAMQQIAREFNLSETVFVLPPVKPGHRARLRIFTPARELRFAGHPTVGTAVLLSGREGGTEARGLVLEEEIGPVTCDVTPAVGGGHASFVLPALPEEAGTPPDNDVLAGALGLAPGDIGFGGFVPSAWSAGVSFIFVPVKSRDAVRRARPMETAALGDEGVYVFSSETADPAHNVHARLFAPHLGVAEDPATGAAAAAFVGVAARFGGLADGNHSFTIEQGYEMGRPSLIRLQMTLLHGKPAAASIGGEAVIVVQGTIEA